MARRPAAALLALALLVLAAAPAARAVPRSNPANALLGVPVDTLTYDHATRCRKGMTKGAVALRRWLEQNVRGEYWGGVRCERLSRTSYSLHSEGRAVDWHLDRSDPADRRAARALLHLLFSRDRRGNENALARRMGIIEAIWDCRYHGFWMRQGRSTRYRACTKGVDVTTAHRDHIHLSLGRRGAAMRTTFWRHVWLRRPLPRPQDPPLPAEPAPGGEAARAAATLAG